MARKRAGGGAIYAVSLVIFVILFVFSLVIAILLYTQVGAANQKAETAAGKLKRYANAQEQARLDADLAARTGDKKDLTAVGTLYADLEELKRLTVNSPTQSMDQIKADIGALRLAEGRSLTLEIAAQRATNASNEGVIKNLEQAKKTADDNVKAAQAEKEAAATTYTQAQQKLEGNLTAIETRHQAYEGTVTNAQKSLTQQFEGVRTASAKSVADLQNKLNQKEQEVAQLQQKLEELQRVVKPLPPTVDQSGLVDGHIASILAEGSSVYIDRGRKDHILPGMTFEIFDKSGVVAKNEVGDYRGKATIQITNVDDDNAAKAAIVRVTKGKTVVEGDVIVNAVYDPNVKYKFVVFGEFDIDNVGQSSVADRRRIETMITEWGALLTDDLTFDTDFLILGQEPKLPDPLKADEQDPDKIQRHAQATARFQMYQKLIATARSLSIPVLNQNRFLSLVGYYRR